MLSREEECILSLLNFTWPSLNNWHSHGNHTLPKGKVTVHQALWVTELSFRSFISLHSEAQQWRLCPLLVSIDGLAGFKVYTEASVDRNSASDLLVHIRLIFCCHSYTRGCPLGAACSLPSRPEAHVPSPTAQLDAVLSTDQSQRSL